MVWRLSIPYRILTNYIMWSCSYMLLLSIPYRILTQGDTEGYKHWVSLSIPYRILTWSTLCCHFCMTLPFNSLPDSHCSICRKSAPRYVIAFNSLPDSHTQSMDRKYIALIPFNSLPDSHITTIKLLNELYNKIFQFPTGFSRPAWQITEGEG